MLAKFGPAGSSDSFFQSGYKGSLQMPAYLEQMSLNAYEYQCGHGVNIGLPKAEQFGAAAAQKGITISLHAPYYISMSSLDAEKREKSVDYILNSARVVHAMGGDRVVVHPGSCGKMERAAALMLAKDTLQKALAALDAQGLSHIRVCPETMGKVNQLGTLEEVLALCALDERLIPCVDFGHLNARGHGCLSDEAAFGAVFGEIENALGLARLREFHVHFSKIEYAAGGEKRHLTFEDQEFGPDYAPMLEWVVRKQCAPVIICESAGTQAEDARAMKQAYEALLGEKKA